MADPDEVAMETDIHLGIRIGERSSQPRYFRLDRLWCSILNSLVSFGDVAGKMRQILIKANPIIISLSSARLCMLINNI